MRGMNAEEYVEVMSYLQDNLSLLAKNREKRHPKVPSVKYIDCCYDTRTATWWSIKFRTWGAFNITLRSNYNNAISLSLGKGVPFNSLYDWCMAYMKGEWIPEESFYEPKNG